MTHRPTSRSAARAPAARLAALALLGAALLAGPVAAGEIVRLRDGTLVHGEITAFDEAVGFTLRRVDTGGEVDLRWEHLPVAEVQRIKASRGFTGEAPEPWLVDVVHLVLKNGTTESGVLVEEGPDDAYTLRRRSGTDSFPRTYVRTVEPGRMEGLEIYAPDELYRVVLETQGEPTEALDHFNLAVACEGAGLHEQAGEHYRRAAEADPGFKPELVQARRERIAVKIEDAVETARLDEVRTRMHRRQYEVALEMLDAFRRDFPLSRQAGDADALEAEVRRRKAEHHGRTIVSDYFSTLEKQLRRLARDEDLPLDVAQQTVEDLLHEEILRALAETYAMTEEGVEALWDERSGGSVRTYSYGTGTFLLGRARALEFGRVDAADDEPDAVEVGERATEEQFEDLVERAKREREDQAAARREGSRAGARLDDAGPGPEEWWAAASADERVKWLMAWFAENAGAVRVIETRGRTCRTCDGSGSVAVVDENGEPARDTCPTCKDLRVERLVRFR